jgi:CDP-diacylglycerol--glycerol-3-phosphate 3-phosphatidyltransferase
MTLKALPNLLTGARLALGLVMFVCLAGPVGAIPFLFEGVEVSGQFQFWQLAVVAFTLAAVTDFFDGWAARRFDAVSVWGAILDPIGDKMLVAGTILGLSAVGPNPHVVAPGALILLREFFVSALREVGAGRGVQFPVTALAKWKTTLQLTALFAQLMVATWPAWRLPADPAVRGPVEVAANLLMWAAAAVTLWTGWQYWRAARAQLSASDHQ